MLILPLRLQLQSRALLLPKPLAVIIFDVLQYHLLYNPNNRDHYPYYYFLYDNGNRNDDLSSFRSKETERGGTCR